MLHMVSDAALIHKLPEGSSSNLACSRWNPTEINLAAAQFRQKYYIIERILYSKEKPINLGDNICLATFTDSIGPDQLPLRGCCEPYKFIEHAGNLVNQIAKNRQILFPKERSCKLSGLDFASMLSLTVKVN